MAEKGAVGLSAAYAAVHGAGPIAVIIILHYAEAGAGHKILLPRLQLLIVFPLSWPHRRKTYSCTMAQTGICWRADRPCRRRIRGAQHLYGAVRLLRVGKILHPFAQKRAAGVVYYFLYAHGAVVNPALALVALGQSVGTGEDCFSSVHSTHCCMRFKARRSRRSCRLPLYRSAPDAR